MFFQISQLRDHCLCHIKEARLTAFLIKKKYVLQEVEQSSLTVRILMNFDMKKYIFLYQAPIKIPLLTESNAC